jgi:hypothetical protein
MLATTINTYKMNDKIIIENLKPILTSYQFRELSATEEKNIQKLISHFDSLNNYSSVILSDSVEIKKYQNISFLVLLSIKITYKEIRTPQNERSFLEYELIGFTILHKDYGRILIRPETIVDKISDLFVHTDLDFDFDKDFSKKYYLAANDEKRARKNISANFLETIRHYNGLEIELDGNILMVRLRKPFSQETGEIIANFLTEINNGYN